MRPEQLAINTVSLRGESVPEELRACAAAGFRNVELCLPEVKPWLAANSVEALGELLGELGLRCIGGFETTICCFGDAAAQAANHDLLVANGELFAALGGGVMVVGTDGPAQPSLEALDAAGAVCAQVAARLPESVALAIEFNWSPLVRSLRSAARLAEAAAHPRVGILFDPAHYHCTASKLQDLEPEIAGRIVHVHVDDMAAKPGEWTHCNADRRLPGEGYLDLPELFGKIEAAGYAGYFSIEMFSDELWALPAAEAAARMYDAMAWLCSVCS